MKYPLLKFTQTNFLLLESDFELSGSLWIMDEKGNKFNTSYVIGQKEYSLPEGFSKV